MVRLQYSGRGVGGGGRGGPARGHYGGRAAPPSAPASAATTFSYPSRHSYSRQQAVVGTSHSGVTSTRQWVRPRPTGDAAETVLQRHAGKGGSTIRESTDLRNCTEATPFGNPADATQTFKRNDNPNWGQDKAMIHGSSNMESTSLKRIAPNKLVLTKTTTTAATISSNAEDNKSHFVSSTDATKTTSMIPPSALSPKSIVHDVASSSSSKLPVPLSEQVCVDNAAASITVARAETMDAEATGKDNHFRRVGLHKLVHVDKLDDSLKSSRLDEPCPNSLRPPALETFAAEQTSLDVPPSLHNNPNFKRLGKHKLVLVSKATDPIADERQRENANERHEEAVAPAAAVVPVVTKEDVETSNQQLRRIGRHKLVVSAGGSAFAVQNATSCDTVSLKRPPDSSRPFSGPTSSTGSFKKFPQAKRIKLCQPISTALNSTSVEPANGDAENAETDNPHKGEIQQEGTAEPKGTEKLTDFAYRERGGPKRGHGVVRCMGLVRVHPNETKTPICPTFLKGIDCTDETCLKRHDVPKECAMPFCSFFQRQGMCWKENCPYQHVKVNPRATLCPSFSLLGFCEDKECNMMHKKKSHSSFHAAASRKP